MSRNNIILLFTFLVLVPLQVLFFKHLALFDLGFCFLYVFFLLLLPIETSALLAMGISFFAGLVVDLFGSTLGIHAASSVFIMFLRPYWLRLIVPRSGFEVNYLPMIANYGLAWFVIYAAPLLLVHAAAVFFIESAGSGVLWLTLSKIGLTAVVTLVYMTALQYLFYTKPKS